MNVNERRAEQVRHVFDAFVSGEFGVLEAELHPRVEFVNPADAVEAGTRIGVEAFVNALRRLHDMFEYAGAEILELVEDGDEAVAVVRFLVAGRGSTVPLDAQFAHLLRWEDGKIRRLEWFRTREDALKALGVAD